MPSFASSIAASGAAGPNSPPSSAAVLEFVCLFTHDLRRKQKRWQDGRLKFHTFNKRVMVYDERGNFIGDMHWRLDHDFAEGEEIQLERGGVMVQVAECVGRREQDLSELIDKRAKEKEERQLKAVARTNASLSARPTPRIPQPDHFQVRHRPLHQLIGTPTGHHGRALAPTESPYEQRHSPNNPPDEQNPRAEKRRKYDDVPSKSGYAQALFGATLTLSATPMSSAPVRPRAFPDRSLSVEVESRESSQEQVPLREQPKSSRHFNSREKRKETEQAPVKPNDWNKQREPPSVIEDFSFATNHQDKRPQKLASSRPDRVRQDVVLVEDDEAEDNDVHHNVETEIVRQPAQPARPLRRAAEHTSTEKHKKRKSRIETEISQEVSDSEPRRVGQSRITTKSKVIDREQPEPRKATPAIDEVAGQTRLLHDSAAKKQPNVPLQKSEEARTELRIKPRKKRGLLMMAEPVAIARRETNQPSLPQAQTTSKTPPVNEQGLEDDPFASSPPRPDLQPSRVRKLEEQTAPLARNSAREKDRDVQVDIVIDDESEDDVPLRAAPKKSKTSKRPKNRPKAILDDDEDEEDVSLPVGPRKRLRQQSTAASPVTVNIDFGVPVEAEAPKEKPRKTRKSKKTREAAEEVAVFDSDTGDTTTSRRNPKRIVAQRRRRSREDTPAELALDSDLAEADEVRQPSKKRRRSEEMPQVPAGPRLARLSKKSVKSREVIGFRLDDTAMFCGLGPRTGPPIQEPAPRQDTEGPAFAATVKPSDRTSSHRNSATKTAQQPESPPPPQLHIVDQREGTKSSKKQAVVEPVRESTPETPERTAKPLEALEVPNNDTLPSNHDRSNKQDAVIPAPPSPLLAQGPKGPVELEVDLLEGVTLSPVVFSPVKPSLPAALAPQELSDDIISAEAPAKTPPVEPKPAIIPSPVQRAPSPPLPERRTINGLGRQNSAIGSLQARNQPAEAPRPEPPKEAPAPAPAPAAKPAPVARIVNPATRGRKAALKSHAAGQVPQPVLPANTALYPAGATVVYVERAPPLPEAAPPPPPPKPAAKKMTFPGFAPARQSGPWSREAFDLLEKPRPV